MSNKIAIIDLGTNTFHLLFAEMREGRYHVTHRERVAVKIGVGGINNRIITQSGVDRALEALTHFSNSIREANITNVHAFGTSALRNARNGLEVAALVQNKTGIEVRIITGDEEAEYIYYGVKAAMKFGKETSLVVDIGGGSVEFIIGNGDSIFWKRSIEIGAQRLLELFHRHEPILPSEIGELDGHLNISLQPLIDAMKVFNPIVLAGSSGTFDTLSEIHCIRKGIIIEPDAPETPLSFQSFHEIFAELVVKNRTERLQIPGMIELRVDMIVVACCLIDYLIKHHSFQNVRVSSYSLKEGVLESFKV